MLYEVITQFSLILLKALIKLIRAFETIKNIYYVVVVVVVTVFFVTFAGEPGIISTL